MITGLIAFVILVSVIPSASENGETGTVIMAIVLAAILLLLGCASRTSDRACNNFVDYWAEGGPDKKK